MLLGFKKRFSTAIESGAKTHTIRDFRKRIPKPGETIHCYEALRTKHCRLLGRWVCSNVQTIRITGFGQVAIADQAADQLGVGLLDPDEKEQLARRDGFESFADMLKFWEGRLPFAGMIVHWDFNRPVNGEKK